MNWNNVQGGAWETATNWSPAKVPVSGDAVIISGSGAGTITLGSVAAFYSLSISGGKKLVVAAGRLTLGPLPLAECVVDGKTYSWIESNIVYNGVDLGAVTAEGTITYHEGGVLNLLASDGYESSGTWYFNANSQLILEWSTPVVQTDTMTILSCTPDKIVSSVIWVQPDLTSGSMLMNLTAVN